MVILITGKAGSGKTTYGERLVHELLSDGIEAVFLDSDQVRPRPRNMEEFNHPDRRNHLLNLADMARDQEEQGRVVIVAAIAPLRSKREIMRSRWKKSRLVFMPGGTMWPGTVYERPSEEEFISNGWPD